MEVFKDGQQAEPGEIGQVFVTNLENRVMPLIRYNLGDLARLSPPRKCQRGSSLQTITKMIGRPEDGLVHSSGFRIPPGPVVESMEDEIGLRDYQVFQGGSGAEVSVKPLGCQSSKNNFDRVKTAICDLLGNQTNVDISAWREDEMPAKYRPVFSTIPAA